MRVCLGPDICQLAHQPHIRLAHFVRLFGMLLVHGLPLASRLHLGLVACALVPLELGVCDRELFGERGQRVAVRGAQRVMCVRERRVTLVLDERQEWDNRSRSSCHE